MSELIFVVEEAPEGGYIARALRQSIFTEADTLAELPGKVREACNPLEISYTVEDDALLDFEAKTMA